MMRARVTLWFPENEDRKVRKHKNVRCKICGIKWALDTAREIESNMGRSEGSISWDLERLAARDMQYAIVWTSRMAPVKVSPRHGHR